MEDDIQVSDWTRTAGWCGCSCGRTGARGRRRHLGSHVRGSSCSEARLRGPKHHFLSPLSERPCGYPRCAFSAPDPGNKPNLSTVGVFPAALAGEHEHIPNETVPKKITQMASRNYCLSSRSPEPSQSRITVDTSAMGEKFAQLLSV